MKHKIILIKLEKENKKFWIFFFKNFHFFLQFFKKCGFFQNFRFSNKYLIINFWDMTLVYGAKCISWFWRFHFWKLLWCARTSARCVPLKMRKMLIFAYILSALVEYSSAQRARKCARAQNFFSSCAPDILDAFCTLNEKFSLKTRIYNLKKALHAYMAIYAWSRGSEPKWDQQVQAHICSLSIGIAGKINSVNFCTVTIEFLIHCDLMLSRIHVRNLGRLSA